MEDTQQTEFRRAEGEGFRSLPSDTASRRSDPVAYQCAVNSPYTNIAMAQVSSRAPIAVTVVPMEARSG
jgi:hypothetical protein